MLLIHRRTPFHSFVLLSLLIIFVSLTIIKADQSTPAVQEKADSSTEITILEKDKPIERELAGGKTHTYEIKLEAGQFLDLVVEQKGIDVQVLLFDLDDKQHVQMNSNGTQGTEPILFIAEVTGNYHLKVRSWDK